MKYLILILIIIAGCREFYDEDFILDAKQEATTEGDISYTAELTSTDPNLTGITGKADVDVENGQVTVQVSVQNIPANLTQLHYSYIAASCSQLNLSIPNENSTLRTYSINETESLTALANDIKSSGAAASDGDVSLQNKSFIVKAIPNFAGLPNPAGTNQITILCGPLIVAATAEGTTSSTTTTTGETTGTTTDTSGSTTGAITTTTTGGGL